MIRAALEDPGSGGGGGGGKKKRGGGGGGGQHTVKSQTWKKKETKEGP